MKNSYFSKKFQSLLRSQLTLSFQTLDQDFKGYIQLSTLKKQFQLLSHSPTQTQLLHLFQLFPSKDKHRIYLNDYLNIMMKQLCPKEYDVEEVFYRITGDREGMTIRDVERLGSQLGESGNGEICRKVFNELDRGNNRSVSLEEFSRVVNKINK